MKNKNAVVLLFVILVVGIAGSVCAQPARIQPVSAQMLKSWLDEGGDVHIFDLRSTLECLDVKISQAVCSFGETDALAAVPKKSRMVFYAGIRPVDQDSPLMKRALSEGFENIFVMQGGLAAWRKEGYPLFSEKRTPRVFAYAVDSRKIPAWQKQAKNPLIVDIREAGVYAAGHIDGAMSIPLSRLHVDYARIPLTATLLVADEDGTQSLLAASYLARKGFLNVQRLKGGMSDYRRRAR